MDRLSFTPLEKSISFYTRNDFAIMNHLLIGNFDELWKYALIAYNDNRGILDEYENGERRLDGDYDVKWVNCLRERIIGDLDDKAKETILSNARQDISNILKAMAPAVKSLRLYRTAWVDKAFASKDTFPYSREYKALQFSMGDCLEIKTISSCSMTPYREDEDIGSDFYRYEIAVPAGLPVLELDRFATHNEDGEVLLPPMKCRVIGMRSSQFSRCKGIVELEYIGPLQ